MFDKIIEKMTQKATSSASEVGRITAAELSELLQKEPLAVLDIRDPESYQHGHIPGAIHIDQQKLESFIQDADKSKPVYVNCYHGMSSLITANQLLKQGFKEVYNVTGGYEAWRQLTNR